MNPNIYEQIHVTEIYDQIASQFDHTRHHTWPSVKHFIDMIPKSETIKIADIGCGNGRNMLLRPDNFIGLDNSQHFINLCHQKNLNAYWGSALDIPFESDTFDYTICIAVIHHLSTPQRRQQVVKELLRITKPQGYILMTVWSSEDQFKTPSLMNSQIIADDRQERLVRWVGNSTETKWRYYHLFIKDELDQLCHTTDPNVEIIKSFEEHGNYGVICQKK